MADSLNKNKKKRERITVSLVIAIILTLAPIVYTYGSQLLSLFKEEKRISNTEALKMIVKIGQITEEMPFMLNDDIRFDNIKYVDNNIQQWRLVYVHLTKEGINVSDLKKDAKQLIKQLLKTNEQMMSFFENETTIVCYYYDKNGMFICKERVTSDIYKN